MDSPRLSIIVPIYNTAPWLRRCLDSLCNQSLRDLEIICVNDGSTDESDSILEEYAARDPRIHIISLETVASRPLATPDSPPAAPSSSPRWIRTTTSRPTPTPSCCLT